MGRDEQLTTKHGQPENVRVVIRRLQFLGSYQKTITDLMYNLKSDSNLKNYALRPQEDSSRRLIAKLENGVPTLHVLYHELGFKPKDNRNTAKFNIVGIVLPNKNIIQIVANDLSVYGGNVDVLINGGVFREMMRRAKTKLNLSLIREGRYEGTSEIYDKSLHTWVSLPMRLIRVSQ